MKTNFLTLFTFLFSISLMGQSLDDGLVAAYTFAKTEFQNNQFMDDTGNDNNISCLNISFFDEDHSGNSLQAVAVGFPEQSSFMQLNEQQNLNVINDLQSLTISFWSTRASYGDQQDFNPMINIEDDNGVAYNLEVDNSLNVFRLTNLENNNVITSTQTSTFYPDDEWHHVAVTIDFVEQRMGIYFDGVKEGESDVANLEAPQHPVISFGKYRNGDYTEFPTCFDNMFIHNRVLSTDEILLAMSESITAVEKNILSPEKINIFPNPAKDMAVLNIEFTGMNSKTLVDITDAQGRLVRTEKLNSSQINIAQLNKGIYFLKIKTEEGSFTRKVLIE